MPKSRSSRTKRHEIQVSWPQISAEIKALDPKKILRIEAGRRRTSASIRMCLSRRVASSAPDKPIHKTRWRTRLSVPNIEMEKRLPGGLKVQVI